MLVTGMSGVGKTHLLGTIENVPEMLLPYSLILMMAQLPSLIEKRSGIFA